MEELSTQSTSKVAWCSQADLRPDSPSRLRNSDSSAVNMPPKERLTAAQHLAKYGADMAFYVNTEEGANIICKPLPYCRLRGDTRQKVLEYLVCVSDKSGERYALRARPHQYFRADEIDDPAPPKPVRIVAGMYYDVPLSRGVLKRSTAAAVDTLIKHSSAIPTTCKTMQLDYKAVVSRPAAINRATPRAWLEHLYCRQSTGMDDQAVKKELIARRKAGKAANLTRDLLQRSASTVEFRHARRAMGGARSNNAGPVGGANDGVQIFRCPATWSDAQKEGATTLLGLSHLRSCRADDLSRGLSMTHARVLTVDEANGKGTCDREQLIQVTKFSLGCVLDRLRGRTLTVVVTNVRLLHNPVVDDATGAAQPVLTPDDYEAMAADLRCVLGSVASDHRLPTAWTNKVPHPYNQYEQCKGRLGKDDFRAAVHDPSEPPITSYAELLRVMAENDVKSTSLDQELVWQTESGVLYHAGAQFDRNALFAPQGSTLVDISLPTDLQLDPQMHELDSPEHRRNPYPSHYFVGIASAKGARPGAALLSGEGAVEFKIDTNIFHERGHLEDAMLFAHFRPGADPFRDARFTLTLSVKIPGMD